MPDTIWTFRESTAERRLELVSAPGRYQYGPRIAQHQSGLQRYRQAFLIQLGDDTISPALTLRPARWDWRAARRREARPGWPRAVSRSPITDERRRYERELSDP